MTSTPSPAPSSPLLKCGLRCCPVLCCAVSAVCAACGLGPARSELYSCARCGREYHLDCLSPRPLRKPPSGIVELCTACRAQLAQLSQGRTEHSHGQHRNGAALGSSPMRSRDRAQANSKAHDGHSHMEADEAEEQGEEDDEYVEEESDEEEGDKDVAHTASPRGLRGGGGSALSVTDPALLASSSPSASASTSPSPLSSSTLPSPVFGIPLISSLRRQPSRAESVGRSAQASFNHSALFSPSSTTKQPSAASSPTPPSASSKLSERLAEVVGGEVGVRFASAVSAVVADRRLEGKELRSLYTRILPNLQSNAALLASVRDGRLSAAELCSMSNKEMAEERVQREREEAARQSLKDVIAAPELLIAKHTKQGVEYVQVTGEKVTTTDMFDDKVLAAAKRSDDAEAEGDEEEPWAASDAPSTRRQRRGSALEQPLSPPSEEDSGGDRLSGQGWARSSAEEQERKYDERTEEADEGKLEEPQPSSRAAAGKRKTRDEVQLDDDGEEVEATERKTDDVDLQTHKRKRTNAEQPLIIGSGGDAELPVPARAAASAAAAPLVSRDPPPAAPSVSAFPSTIQVDDDEGSSRVELPTIDRFTAPLSPSSFSLPDVAAPMKALSPKPATKPGISATTAAPPSKLTPPPTASRTLPLATSSTPQSSIAPPVSAPSPASPPSPPDSPNDVFVIPSFRPVSWSRSAQFFSGPLHSRVRWSSALHFEHHLAVIPFTARLVGISGQSDNQEAVRVLSASQLPSRVSVTGREPVAAVGGLLRELSQSDLRMAALFVLSPAAGHLKALEAFCSFHSDRERVGISDHRGPDRVGLFFRFGRLAAADAGQQLRELTPHVLQDTFSGVGGIRTERAFYCIVAYLDKRKTAGGPAAMPPTASPTAASSGFSRAAPSSVRSAASPPPSPSMAAPKPSSSAAPPLYSPQASPASYVPLPPVPAPLPLRPPPAPPSDPRSRPTPAAANEPLPARYAPPAPPVAYSQPLLPAVHTEAPAGYPAAAAARAPLPVQSSLDPVLSLLSSIRPAPSAAYEAVPPSYRWPPPAASPSPPHLSAAFPARSSYSPPRDPRAAPPRRRSPSPPPRPYRDEGQASSYTDRDRGTRSYGGVESAYSSSLERAKERDRLLDAQRTRGGSAYSTPHASQRSAEWDVRERERERQLQEDRERERMRLTHHSSGTSSSSRGVSPPQQPPPQPPRTSGFIHPSRMQQRR